MCGIAGFIDFNKKSTPDILTKMSDTLAHRGPDGSGTFLQEKGNFQLGLAHRRLSIIDLSNNGSQPMQHKNLHITFNGEIYNYKEIKKELQQNGNFFQSDSDTEVILQAFDAWGINCLEKFIGMFVFVIYDSAKNEIYCARDRAGVKPFFYYFANNLFLFASELKAFHQHPGFKKELNLDAVAAFAQHGNVPTPYCIFNHCYKLKAGHYLKINPEKITISEHQYWNVYNAYNKPKLNISFEDAKTQTEDILMSAFRYRMVSDVPVGVFLSGGYDSTCLTALLMAGSSKKLQTFTIGIKDSSLNEAPYAKETANYLGTDHTEIYCEEKDALDLIPYLTSIYDEPFGDQSAIPTMLVSKLSRDKVKVVLSADGGDEVFAGYNRYDFLLKQGKFLNQIPAPLRNLSAGIMSKISAEKLPVVGKRYNFANRYEKLKMLLRDPSAEKFMFSMSTQYSEKEFKNLISHPYQALNTAYHAQELKKEFYTDLSYMMAIDYQTYMLDDILQKVDRATMAFGLEGREPFLDHRIIEYAAQLPDDFKYHKGIKKYILREITHKYVPKKMLDRPKMGFAIPLENWLCKELKPLVTEYLSPEQINRSGVFHASYVSQLLKNFYDGKKELGQKIWYLLMFQMWYKKWMN
ncbi:asparagine synthase (glutamine-hydrolyzing) [Sphingobacteriaceae bacterium]|nr:asparagine synthase (glutamine-hydrolyzing) [Sphingobacteriaceae bacterium]